MKNEKETQSMVQSSVPYPELTVYTLLRMGQRFVDKDGEV